MNIIILSLSYSIDKRLDGIIGDKIREIAKVYTHALFVLERTINKMDFLLGDHEIVVYNPVFAKFGSKAEAFIDRNKRMVKYGTECYCMMDIDDEGLYPIDVAHYFMEKHPGYTCKVFVHVDGILKEISVERAKELFKWKMEMSRYR